MNDIYLGGERVSSKDYLPVQQVPETPLSGKDRRIGEAIPFWPGRITASELSRKLGMKEGSVVTRLAAVQRKFLVCEDGGGYSRIRDDLSNIA